MPMDLAYCVRTHLRYELQWMIYAANAFQRCSDDSYVALLDSAAIHARNLLEWASLNSKRRFTLCALGGRTATLKPWVRWLNNRVAHMPEREKDKAPWPGGRGTWDRRDKLMTMAKVVLDRLRDGVQGMPNGPGRDAYLSVMVAAEEYWRDPSTKNFGALAALHDGSHDEAYPE